jgi:hypothetical protein
VDNSNLQKNDYTQVIYYKLMLCMQNDNWRIYMKTIPLLTVIMLLFNISYSAVIKGSLVDSTSGKPVDSAKLSFRIGNSPNEYPSTISDANGLFSIELSVSNGYPLQVIIEKSGYVNKIYRITINSDTMNVGAISLEQFLQKEIRLLGTVIDSVSRLPVIGAKISLTKIKMGSYIPDQNCVTDSSGSFYLKAMLSNDYVLVATASQSGYYPSSFDITPDIDSSHLTILLQPEGSIRIAVSGRVVDSRTGVPVNNARVILMTTYHDVKADTSFTNSNSAFTRSVQAGITSSAIPAIVCMINAEDYMPYTTYKNLTSRQAIGFDKIDMEEITIIKNNAVRILINQPKKDNTFITDVTGVSIMTLNGRIIQGKNKNFAISGLPSQLLLLKEKRGSPGNVLRLAK